jgi:hypothetical protein
MKRFTWRTNLILSLIVVSLIFYLINYLIFRDPPFMLRLLTLQLAFVPISVILITLFLNGLFVRREKRARLEKMNMVIGTFFSEVGTDLLKAFSNFDPHRERISEGLIVTPDWSDLDFVRARTQAKDYDYGVEINVEKLEELRSFLIGERVFLVRLLENPHLLEHESFTDLLWAIFHLSDELSHREDVSKLPDTDYEHLANDMKRAYGLLISEWIAYIRHLRDSYPYLYSLAIRTNPLDPNASPEVR